MQTSAWVYQLNIPLIALDSSALLALTCTFCELVSSSVVTYEDHLLNRTWLPDFRRRMTWDRLLRHGNSEMHCCSFIPLSLCSQTFMLDWMIGGARQWRSKRGSAAICR